MSILEQCRHDPGVVGYHPGGQDEADDEVLGVEIVGGLEEASTPWAGASLLAELFRRSGVDEMANNVLPGKGPARNSSGGKQ